MVVVADRNRIRHLLSQVLSKRVVFTSQYPRNQDTIMSLNKTIKNVLRVATHPQWIWSAPAFVAMIMIAFMATGCGGGTHPH